MSFRTRGPGPPPPSTPWRPGDRRPAGGFQRWTTVGRLLAVALLILVTVGTAVGEVNKKYNMDTLCKDYFRQQQLRKIDGAELVSQNEQNLNCVITFQTHSILQSFMLRFEDLHIDCNDHLYIYDGAHAVSTPKWDLSCRDTRELVGPIHTRTNHVTLKYVTDNWGTERCGFHLIITAIKDAQTACNDFKCKTKEFCIHTDLVCDGVNHCGDGSDEAASDKCGRGEMGLVLGMSITNVVVGGVSALLILGLAVVGVAVCVYRQAPVSANANAFQAVHHGHVGLNGAGHTASALNHGLGHGLGHGIGHGPGTTTLMGNTMNPPHTLSLMQPGNWGRPVGTQLGYSAVWARLFCCLVK